MSWAWACCLLRFFSCARGGLFEVQSDTAVITLLSFVERADCRRTPGTGQDKQFLHHLYRAPKRGRSSSAEESAVVGGGNSAAARGSRRAPARWQVVLDSGKRGMAVSPGAGVQAAWK